MVKFQLLWDYLLWSLLITSVSNFPPYCCVSAPGSASLSWVVSAKQTGQFGTGHKTLYMKPMFAYVCIEGSGGIRVCEALSNSHLSWDNSTDFPSVARCDPPGDFNVTEKETKENIS